MIGITIRPMGPEDAAGYREMLLQLDEETDFMLYEPGERAQAMPDDAAAERIIADSLRHHDLLLAAADGSEIIGFFMARKGRNIRTAHTAYIVIGIRAGWRHAGIGTAFFAQLEPWASQEGIVRADLTVECDNAAAQALYRQSGFAVEGRRRKTMKVYGEYRDEYMMARLFGQEDTDGRETE